MFLAAMIIAGINIQSDWLKRVYHSRLFAQALKLTRAKVIHFLGDSHTEMFQYIARQYLWLHTRFEFSIVQGGTAMGLVHPKSQTQALSVFSNYIQKISKKDSLFFCIGEVDCGFLIWYRSHKYGVPVDEQFQLSIHNYLTFLDSVEQQGFANISICSIPLPTIFDDRDWGEVANLRKEVKTSIKERTELTIKYNQQLQIHCQNKNWNFLDFEKDILDPKTGLIDHRFRHPNPLNHHLNEKTVAPLLVAKLKSYGYW